MLPSTSFSLQRAIFVSYSRLLSISDALILQVIQIKGDIGNCWFVSPTSEGLLKLKSNLEAAVDGFIARIRGSRYVSRDGIF